MAYIDPSMLQIFIRTFKCFYINSYHSDENYLLVAMKPGREWSNACRMFVEGTLLEHCRVIQSIG